MTIQKQPVILEKSCSREACWPPMTSSRHGYGLSYLVDRVNFIRKINCKLNDSLLKEIHHWKKKRQTKSQPKITGPTARKSMVRIKTWCCNLLWTRAGWTVWLCLLWCTFESSRCHFDLRFSLWKQTWLNECWSVFLPCKTSHVLGSPEWPHGRSVCALEPFLMDGFIKANCRTPNYFPHTWEGLANASVLCFSDEEQCCHIAGRVNSGLENPLSKEYYWFLALLYHFMGALRQWLALRGDPKRICTEGRYSSSPQDLFSASGWSLWFWHSDLWLENFWKRVQSSY